MRHRKIYKSTLSVTAFVAKVINWTEQKTSSNFFMYFRKKTKSINERILRRSSCDIEKKASNTSINLSIGSNLDKIKVVYSPVTPLTVSWMPESSFKVFKTLRFHHIVSWEIWLKDRQSFHRFKRFYMVENEKCFSLLSSTMEACRDLKHLGIFLFLNWTTFWRRN